ncbi:hypothetical protein [Simkania negevensis]|uniref:Uncharacterized protein n=1 Tax=Simkania negevensis (strain ATCC VR-1471 / DSM 27360 / Z) TaxID=331113 RepID=F8L6G8_SIMNZ|nr:hypothetical protein [Simkania negevensis]CCB88303.1 unknown protein [Simkania negevensis Z]
MSSTDSIDYAQEWQDDLNYLGTIQDGSTAIEYCFTNLLPDLCGFYEQQMSELAVVMNDLTECLNLENEIQALFNEGSEYTSDKDPNGLVDYEDDVEEMMKDAQELEDLLEQDEDVLGASTVEDIETQLDSIFSWGLDYNDPDAVCQNATNFISAWDASEDAKNSDDVENAQYDANQMQVYDDAFNAMSNDLSSMSSQVQSELQYEESCDQQMQGLISDMEQQWAQTEQVMVNNEITG